MIQIKNYYFTFFFDVKIRKPEWGNIKLTRSFPGISHRLPELRVPFELHDMLYYLLFQNRVFDLREELMKSRIKPGSYHFFIFEMKLSKSMLLNCPRSYRFKASSVLLANSKSSFRALSNLLAFFMISCSSVCISRSLSP